MGTATIILAAGKGTRMNSDLPKVLHPLAGVPMLHHAMAAAATLEPDLQVVVTGHVAEAVANAARDFDDSAKTALQSEQLGTGHAVQQALPALEGFEGQVIVLYGDTPFVSTKTLKELAESTADVTVLGFEAADPARYGRLIMDGDTLLRIVEWKDASPAERGINLCNSGVMAMQAKLLRDLLSQLKNDNASGEYYLTDLPGIARGAGKTTGVVTCPEAETMGIDNLAQLSRAEGIWQASKRSSLLENGVMMQAPDTVYFGFDTEIGRGTVIEPNVVFGKGVTVESGAHIRAFSHLEGAHVSRGAVVGPYARLRPGTELSEDTKVGNFVEVKNALLAEGAKVNHLSYVGDASIGERSNIGAGTITCNYDGVSKHKTEIGADVFVGSNTMLVAPVTVGDAAMTASGSVITSNVTPEALAIARARQTEKPGAAKKLMDMLRARKAQRQRSD